MNSLLPLVKTLVISLALALAPIAHAAPAMDWPQDIPPATKAWLEKSMAAVAENPSVPYKYGSASPKEGMDCSGAVTYLLGLIDVSAPRSSAGMHEWLAKTTTYVVVPADARDIAHPVYQKLRPGDLVFWAREGEKVSHVQIYLGKEKSDGRHVMIGASEGRSYRGEKKSGFAIVDFKVPKAGVDKRIIGFGPLPRK